MSLTPSAGGLRGLFAAVPDSCYLHERRCQEKVATRHDYIARVEGTRTYPWRILAVADEDRELPTNDLVYALAAENRIGDCSWVKPGKVAWEWWNDWGLTGVDFEPGINTRTYKAYIDFAADYGLEYVVLDEGWSDPKAGDVMSVVEQIDLPGSPPRTAWCSISTAFTNPRVRTAPIPISSISKASSGWRNSSGAIPTCRSTT